MITTLLLSRALPLLFLFLPPRPCLTSMRIFTAVRACSHSLLCFLTAHIDLYGNDEVELTEDFQEDLDTIQELAPAELATPTSARPADKASTPPLQKTAQDAPAKSQIPTYTSSVAPVPSAKPIASSFTQSTLQQIPTFEQQQSQEYHDGQLSRNQNIPVPERSVRPSEMKDEG